MTTPRIPPVAPADAAPDVKPLAATYLEERGNVPKMSPPVAQRPGPLRTLIPHLPTVEPAA